MFGAVVKTFCVFFAVTREFLLESEAVDQIRLDRQTSPWLQYFRRRSTGFCIAERLRLYSRKPTPSANVNISLHIDFTDTLTSPCAKETLSIHTAIDAGTLHTNATWNIPLRARISVVLLNVLIRQGGWLCNLPSFVTRKGDYKEGESANQVMHSLKKAKMRLHSLLSQICHLIMPGLCSHSILHVILLSPISIPSAQQ